MTIIKIILLILLLAVAITFLTLFRNEANLFQPPGMGERLHVFLTKNTAATSDDHRFEELRTPVFDLCAEDMYQRVLIVAAEIGWNIVAHDIESQNVNFVVLSPMLLFEDDVFVQIKFVSMEQSSLYIQSSSRIGRTDLAANSAHIQDLIEGLRN